MSGVRFFGLLRCWRCWKPGEIFGNTLQWTPWCGYGVVHFVGAKVNFPKCKVVLSGVACPLQTSTGAAADGRWEQKEVTSRNFLLPCLWSVN